MAREDRQNRLRLAEYIIRAHPTWGRDRINEELRRQTGTGLRKQYVNDLKHAVLATRAKTLPARERSRVIRVVSKRSWYGALLDAGFLQFEVSIFKDVPPDVPYMQTMYWDRLHRYLEALREGMSRQGWREWVRTMYRQAGWGSPWDLLRDWEDRYRGKNPEYESPWERKRRRTTRDFRSFMEEGRAEQKYPRGRVYR